VRRFVSMGDRKFLVVRSCRSEGMTEEKRNAIKNSSILIDIVLDDGRGNMLFCHEARDVEYRDIDPNESLVQQELDGVEE
jgi:hypothetical protein